MLYKQNREVEKDEEMVLTKSNSDYTRSQISHITQFLSFVYNQMSKKQQEGKKYYVMQYFTTHHLQKYYSFQLDNCGKHALTQGSYFRNLFETFRFVTDKLELWIPTLDTVSKASKEKFLAIMKQTNSWIRDHISHVNFKDKIWVNMSKHSLWLKERKLDITKEDFGKVETTAVSIITLFHKLWINLKECPETRNNIWNIRGYHVMESHCWLILLHLWLFGIRPGSLLQCTKNSLLCQVQENNVFTLSFKFLGNDKSQYGGVDRRLGFSTMVSEFLMFAYERIPLAHEFYGRNINNPLLFLSYKGQPLTKDCVTVMVRNFYALTINKYTFPRMIRFWLGNYAYEKCRVNDDELLKVCYLFNHSISTHMKYYVCSDKTVEHEPSEDSAFYKKIME